MSPEDRIRAALDDRAARARTSPGALDGVFRRVSRHRRNVRVAASLAAASVVAVAAVAVAAGRTPGDRFVVQPTATPTPTATVTAAPPDRAYVLLKGDDHVIEVDTTTGTVLRDVVAAPFGAGDLTTDADRAVLAFETEGCNVTVVDTRTGATSELAGGRPALSPDGLSLATTGCDDGTVVVTDLATGTRTVYARRRGPSVPPDTVDVEALAHPASLAWLDTRHLAIARVYETAEDMLVLDLDADRSLSDATPAPVAFDHVTALHGVAIGAEACCMPDWDKPTKIARLHAGEREVLFEANPGVDQITTDHTGAVLYGDMDGVWRWDGGDAPRLLLRGNVLGVAG
jgi:hypothetical protein